MKRRKWFWWRGVHSFPETGMASDAPHWMFSPMRTFTEADETLNSGRVLSCDPFQKRIGPFVLRTNVVVLPRYKDPKRLQDHASWSCAFCLPPRLPTCTVESFIYLH
jgi:hypothetical protein